MLEFEQCVGKVGTRIAVDLAAVLDGLAVEVGRFRVISGVLPLFPGTEQHFGARHAAGDRPGQFGQAQRGGGMIAGTQRVELHVVEIVFGHMRHP